MEDQLLQALRRFIKAYAKPCKMSAHDPLVFLNTGEQLECYSFGSTNGKQNDTVMFIRLDDGNRPLVFGFGGPTHDWRFVLIEGSSFFALDLVSFNGTKLVLKRSREFNVLPNN